jgi:hypothetical protein
MAGVKTLRRIQMGAEATPGTELDATFKWRGVGSIADETEVQFAEEDVGFIAPTLRSYIAQEIATLELADTEATFEQLPYILSAGISEEAGVQDGAGTLYIYDYDFAEAALNTIKTYTVEMGNNQQEEQMLYAFCREFGLSGAAGEAVMMNGTLQGDVVAPGTFTADPGLDVVEEIVFQKGKLYIDPTSGAFGATQVSLSLLNFSLSVVTGVKAYFTADGALKFSGIEYVQPEITLEMTFKHNASAVTEIANWRAETPRLVSLVFEGSVPTTVGTIYSLKTLVINLAGKFVTVGPLEDEDGDDVRSFSMRVGYDETAADIGNIVVVNELAALP